MSRRYLAFLVAHQDAFVLESLTKLLYKEEIGRNNTFQSERSLILRQALMIRNKKGRFCLADETSSVYIIVRETHQILSHAF